MSDHSPSHRSRRERDLSPRSLSPSEETRCWREWREARDVAARDRLFTRYEYLAERAARRYRAVDSERDDLLQEARLGLLAALTTYDPQHVSRARFVTWAVNKIQAGLLEYRRRQAWGSRRMQDAVRAAQDGKAPLPEYSYLEPLSLQQAWEGASGEDDETRTVESGLAAPGLTPEAHALRHRAREALWTAIRDLPPREQTVLALYYGQEYCLREIAEVLPSQHGPRMVTTARVAQLRQQALRRLRTHLVGTALDRQAEVG